MIFRLLGLIVLPLLAWWLGHSLSKRFALTARQSRILFVIIAALLVVGVLILLGRLPAQFIIAPLGAAAAFILRFLPTLLRLMPFWGMLKSRVAGAGHRHSNQSSRIRTEFFDMELQHQSGNLDGRILKGQFVNQQLSALSLEQLLQVYRDCASDSDSVQILEAYLDRAHADWRQHSGTQSQARGEPDESVMTKALALEILGLEGEPDKQAIVTAHRHLMQKMHPDRGGSSYLAKKINAAKEFLLQHLT